MSLPTDVQLPRVVIRFCVQCKWNLRAAYFAQELLSTFSNDLGEVSLVPVTGGIFTVVLYTREGDDIATHQIWDRKVDGGFPETKELKNRVRNIVDPNRDMGHVDRALKRGKDNETARHEHTMGESQAECEECKEAARAG